MDAYISVLVVMGGSIAVVLMTAFVCLAIDRWRWGPPPTQVEMTAVRQQHLQCLLSPQWSDLEEHFGASMPNDLRMLYEGRDRLMEVSFYVVPPNRPEQADYWFIQQFEPADLETLKTSFRLIGCGEDASVAKKRFAFASDDGGDSFFVEMGPQSSVELPVFYYDHDGGSIDQVADSIAEFIQWERRYQT